MISSVIRFLTILIIVIASVNVVVLARLEKENWSHKVLQPLGDYGSGGDFKVMELSDN